MRSVRSLDSLRPHLFFSGQSQTFDVLTTLQSVLKFSESEYNEWINGSFQWLDLKNV